MVEGSGYSWVTGVASLLAGLGFPGFVVWLIRHYGAREDRIEILRKALDKRLIRENAYCGALDALVFGIDHLEDPGPALLAARARALEIMETAHSQIRGGTA